MLASDFDIQLPSWESPVPEQPSESANSTRTDLEVESDLVEIELLFDDEGEVLPMWETVIEVAIELRQTAAEESNILYEHEAIEQEFQDTILCLSQASSADTNNKAAYSLSSSLRCTCVAHILQLVIKDGIKAMGVSDW